MKNEGVNTQDYAWLKRCEDFEQSVRKYKSVRFSRFVSPHDLAVFRAHFHPSPFVNVSSFGGTDDCERVQIGFFPEFQEPDNDAFPICAMLVTGVLGCTHRDILGAILGLGIKREMVGDIYVQENIAVIMCDVQVREFLLFHLDKVGRKKVTVSDCPKEKAYALEHAYVLVRHIVASLRLDAVVGAIAKMSRSEASACILAGNVNLNFVETEDSSKKLCQGDTISVRHHGRFVLNEICGETKKGRTVVEIKQYV